MSQLPVKIMVTQELQRLDLQSGKVLEKQMASLVPHPHDLWVFDLAQVDFMDSSGLVALVKGLKAARNSGCRLVLCNLQASVQLVFELTQLDSVFEIFESYDAVLTTVNTPMLVA
jgi:anti-anti-sigma factor